MSLDGELIYHYPASLKELNRCKPVYEELPGWSEDITGCRDLADLPENARNYVRRVSELVWRTNLYFFCRTRSDTNEYYGKCLGANLTYCETSNQLSSKMDLLLSGCFGGF